MTTFDRFSARARRVLTAAQSEARSFGHDHIGTEHLLLGMIVDIESMAGQALAETGVEAEPARAALEVIDGRGQIGPDEDLVLTPRLQSVLNLAIDEAAQLGHSQVEVEHLLLAMIREGDGIGVGVLDRLGVKLDDVNSALSRILGLPVPEPEPKLPEQPQDPDAALAAAEDAESSTGAPNRSTRYFDRFTERARKVLQLAQEEAQRFNHNYIGTEHLLLGLVREGDGVAARVLNNMGVQLPKVRAAVEFIIGRGEGAVIGEIGLTPRAKKVLELAVDEGRRLNHHYIYIGTEHLLLGLVREGEGIAAGVLESLGVNLEKVRAQVMLVLDGPGGNPEPELERPGRALRASAAAAAAALADECQAGPRSPLALQPGGPPVTPLVAQTWHRAESLAEESASIDSSHLVRALVDGPDSAASVMLDRHRVTADRVADASRAIVAAWRKRIPDGPLEAPGIVGQILDLAGEISSETGRGYVCTLDLLRAMLNTRGSLATAMLSYAVPVQGSLRDEVDVLIAAIGVLLAQDESPAGSDTPS